MIGIGKWSCSIDTMMFRGEVILTIADDLYHDCRMEEDSDYDDSVWVRKYIECTYTGR